MIEKVTKLHGIGTLHAPLQSEALTFKNKVILYAENGRGKTTFVAVLRSLALGEASALLQRKSIRGIHPQTAQFLIASKPHDLTNGQWTRPHPSISIFDAVFINDNIYTGAAVAADHRKNLLSFALGEEGVKLAHKVDEIAAQISDQRRIETEAKGKVQTHISGAMTPEEFLRLPSAGENAQSELTSRQRAREAQARATTLAQLQTLSPIEFDDFTLADLEEVLGRTVESISKSAENQLRAHLERVHATEEWIAEGASFDAGGRCPYCAQEINRSEIAPVFSTYFSAAYREFKQALKADLSDLQQRLDAATLTRIRTVFENNRSRLLQWRDFLPEARLDLDISLLIRDIRDAGLVLGNVANKKLAEPLEPVILNAEEISAIGAIKLAATAIDDYNASQVQINGAAQEVRNSTERGNLAQAEADLLRIRNQISRYSDKARIDCDSWKAATSKREKLEADKAKARRELDEHTESILNRYRDAMNLHLKGCGTSFRISTLKTTYAGGIPRCEYGIELLGAPVDLANKPTSPVTFDYALSQGDKNALAFAFFLARAESDPQRTAKIIVFDDPLSSLDSCRRRYTRTKIAELTSQVSQVIVLTHEEATVADFCARLGEADCSIFELKGPRRLQRLRICERQGDYG